MLAHQQFQLNIHILSHKKLIVVHKSASLGSVTLVPGPHVPWAAAKWSNWYKLVSLIRPSVTFAAFLMNTLILFVWIIPLINNTIKDGGVAPQRSFVHGLTPCLYFLWRSTSRRNPVFQMLGLSLNHWDDSSATLRSPYSKPTVSSDRGRRRSHTALRRPHLESCSSALTF